MHDHWKIVVIPPDGFASDELLPKGALASLDALRLLIGGPIQIVPLPHKKYLVINEEAKYAPHQVNREATALATSAESIPVGDYIAGTAVIADHAVFEQD